MNNFLSPVSSALTSKELHGYFIKPSCSLYDWLRGLRRRPTAAWLLGSRVRIPLVAWMCVSCVYMLCCPV
jgi:hypothetical protein